MLRKLRFLAAYALYCVAVCAVAVLVVEGVLRAFTDRPLGLFDATPLNHTSLYHPSSRIAMDLMAVPYVIETNSLGFRGPEIAREKPAGTTRIIALGDSITDGYMVDNPDTYPVRLESHLREAGYRVEVINAARGGSSINREFWILKTFCAGLDPDVVVLTFVGNDIYELRDLTPEAALKYSPEPTRRADNAALLAARTALGEWLLDTYLGARFPGYRGQSNPAAAQPGPERYDIPGGRDYTAILPEATAKLQSLKLHLPELDAGLRERVDVYLEVLTGVRNWCADRDIQLVWVWYPTFVQTYGDTPDEPIYAYLVPKVREQGIPVIDVTPSFREADRATPLYLAPVDYHLTPKGNQLLAKTIGEGLIEHAILGTNTEVE